MNALVQSAGSQFWKKWLQAQMPSGDSIGRVGAELRTQDLRNSLHHIYARLKRNKALPGIGGLTVAVLDGHETCASYLRHCPQCLERRVRIGAGEKVQYYHRQVTLMLVSGRLRLLLDTELQRPGEDEVATAIRLLRRALVNYPRAFQLLVTDALYCQAPFINFLWAHRKYILAVLKDDRRDIYQDVIGLCQLIKPSQGSYRKRKCLWWDISGVQSWPQVNSPIRVIRSQETYFIRRQATKTITSETTEWLWITNLPRSLAGTELVVRLGHARWDIENYGFNELVNGWHTDHVYKHDPVAIEAFYLIAFIAFNIYHAFLLLNLKPEYRRGKTDRFWICLLISEIYPPALASKHIRAP